jgi:hypothetical protein
MLFAGRNVCAADSSPPSPANPTAESASPSDGSGSFETFEIPNPQGTAVSSEEEEPKPPKPSSYSPPDVSYRMPSGNMKSGLRILAALTIDPNIRMLNLGMTGGFGGRTYQTSLRINPGGQGPFLNADYLSSSRGEQSIIYGRSSDPLFGAVSGLRYEMKHEKGYDYGGGFYTLQSGATSRYVIGADVQKTMKGGGKIGALAGADGSWQLFGQRETNRLSAYLQLGLLSSTGNFNWNAYLSDSLSQNFRVSERLSRQIGSGGSSSDATTFLSRAGNAILTGNFLHVNASDDRVSANDFSVSLPVFGRPLNVGYQSSRETKPNEGTITQELYLASLYASLSGGRFFTGEVGWDPVRGADWKAGLSMPFFGKGSQVFLNIGQQPGMGFSVQEARLTTSLSPDSTIRLRFTPPQGRGVFTKAGWGIDYLQRFEYAPEDRGTVEGTVAVDGGEVPNGLEVLLDGKASLPVGENGRFGPKKVASGVHRLSLDLTKIPAQLGAESTDAEILVNAKKTTQQEFRLQRLSSISGQVRSLKPLSADAAAKNPFQGIVIWMNGKKWTQTDADGHYRFTNLSSGDYVVELRPEYLPADATAVGPMKWTLPVRPGGDVTGADFTIEIKEKPVVIQEFPPE